MDAPKRIWASCNTPLALSKSGTWHERPYGEEYILSAEHDRLMAEKNAEILTWRKVAMSATPNGSEYTDPEYARAFIQERREAYHNAMKRAVLAERKVDEKDAEIARLRKALTTIAEVRMVQGDEWPANNNFSMWLIARAALGDSHE